MTPINLPQLPPPATLFTPYHPLQTVNCYYPFCFHSGVLCRYLLDICISILLPKLLILLYYNLFYHWINVSASGLLLPAPPAAYLYPMLIPNLGASGTQAPAHFVSLTTSPTTRLPTPNPACLRHLGHAACLLPVLDLVAAGRDATAGQDHTCHDLPHLTLPCPFPELPSYVNHCPACHYHLYFPPGTYPALPMRYHLPAMPVQEKHIANCFATATFIGLMQDWVEPTTIT